MRQRWINLYFIVLQPSELMKIGIILCLAKYYHRLKIDNINSFTSILVALSIIIVPVILVVSQPDLGTSILIALSGLIILWVGGLKIKYLFVSFRTPMLSAFLSMSKLFSNKKINKISNSPQ